MNEDNYTDDVNNMTRRHLEHFEYHGITYHSGDRLKASYKLHHTDSDEQVLHLDNVYFVCYERNDNTGNNRIGVSPINPSEIEKQVLSDRKLLKAKTIYIPEHNIEDLVLLPQKNS